LGPGANQFESTKIIGSRIYDAASRLLRSGGGTEVTGSLEFIHQFVDMAAQRGTYQNPVTNVVENYRGCLPAMG
jgi:neutral ceramidase